MSGFCGEATGVDVYCLTHERKSFPFMTPRLESVFRERVFGDKTEETAPLSIVQMWEFMQTQLYQAEQREMRVGTLVMGESRTKKTHQIFIFFKPCRFYGEIFLCGKNNL